ncbi:hypothetical protein [Cellulomonas fengjieae]|uniref:Uncharacterized protein n=1 Tax=Cellulomonas fengjieae TaxID=2819978 RepID=A0ABS3SI02_9CELL|nr:hypothetical protein [Cellulomonas fengjieae]MBO3085375.1 hypothetical protein [Cellulomonas fengjieae]QVI66073.1 hypothetical protein KG102_00065 [Cellulomonas fengjieae]
METDAPAVDTLAAPWRAVERRARRVVGAILLGVLATALVGASVPLWSSAESLQLAAAVYRSGTGSVLRWEVAPSDAWCVGLVALILPGIAAVVGWARSRSARSHAVPALAALVAGGSAGGRLSEAQRRARERGRQQEVTTQVRHYTEQHRPRLSAWTTLGGTFAILGGVWALVAVVLSAAGATSTVVGAFVAVYSWFIVLIGAVVVYALAHGAGALRRRRGAAPRPPATADRTP